MASSVDLVVRILADVGSAQASFSGLMGSIGKLAGVGALYHGRRLRARWGRSWWPIGWQARLVAQRPIGEAD